MNRPIITKKAVFITIAIKTVLTLITFKLFGGLPAVILGLVLFSFGTPYKAN